MAERVEVAAVINVTDQASAAVGAIQQRFEQMAQQARSVGQRVQQAFSYQNFKNIGQNFGNLGNAFRGLGQTLGNIIKPVAALLGLGAGVGIYESIENFKDWVQTARDLPAAARNLGTTMEELQTWREVARQANIDAGTFDTALGRLRRSIDLAARFPKGKGKDLASYFENAGIAIRNADGSIRSATEILPEFIRNVSKQGDAGMRAALAQGVLGRGMEDMLRLLGASPEVIAEYIKSAEEMRKITEEDAKAAEAYHKATEQVRRVFQDLGREIFPLIAPELTKMATAFANYIRENKTDIVQGITNAFTAFANLLKSIDWDALFKQIGEWVKWFTEGGRATDIMKTAFQAFLALKFFAIVKDIWAIVAALKGLGAAFGLSNPVMLAIVALAALAFYLWQNWETVQKNFNAMWVAIGRDFWAVVDWLRVFYDEFVPEPIKVIWRTLTTFFTQLFSGDIKGAFWTAVGWIPEFLLAFIPQPIKDLWNTLTAWATQLWADVKAGFWIAVTWLSNFLKEFLPQPIIDLWNSLTGFFTTLWDGIKSIFKNAWDWIDQNVLEPMRKALKWIEDSKLGQAVGYVAGGAKAVAGAVKEQVTSDEFWRLPWQTSKQIKDAADAVNDNIQQVANLPVPPVPPPGLVPTLTGAPPGAAAVPSVYAPAPVQAAQGLRGERGPTGEVRVTVNLVNAPPGTTATVSTTGEGIIASDVNVGVSMASAEAA